MLVEFSENERKEVERLRRLIDNDVVHVKRITEFLEGLGRKFKKESTGPKPRALKSKARDDKYRARFAMKVAT